MKLLELLVQEKVQWPDGALWAVQDGDKELKFDSAETPPDITMSSSGMVWYRQGDMSFCDVYLDMLASDWNAKAVSKAEYDAAGAANTEWVPVKWGDWQIGDELRFDGYTQYGELHKHWGWVVGSVYMVVAHPGIFNGFGPTNGRSIAHRDWGFKFSKRKPSASTLTPAPVPPTVVTTPVLHWYELLAPVIAAAAEGKVVQYLAADGNWYDGSAAFMHPNAYRIKPEEPKTIKVNGFDVPEPMREALTDDTKYYLASTHAANYYEWAVWCGDVSDMRWLSRGVLHSTKEAAIAHAKAMLGIDPYATEDADDEHA